MSVRGWIRIPYSAWTSLFVVLVWGCGDETVAPSTPGLSIQLAPTNSGDQQTGTVATPLLNPLRVLVRRGSAAAPGITVRWTVVGGTLGTQGSLSATTTTTDATGIATVSWSLGQVAGQQRAMASISDPAQSADSSVAFTAIANPGPASRLRFSVNPTNTFSGRPIRPAVTVSVVDAFDNPTGSAATITVALGAHSGTGVLSGTSRVDAAGGVATFADLSIDQGATGYTLMASATGLPSATSAAFDVVTPGPDQIAFVRYYDSWHGDVYLMNADGSGQVNITNNPAVYYFVWSPDGTRIAFVTDRDGNYGIYVMNADGSGQVNLTHNPATDANLAWSPDGSKIAFDSDRDGNGEIYVMNPDGSSWVKLTNSPAAWNDSPAWSPDGSKIAFTSGRDGNSEIYVMNADGSGQVNLTNNPAADAVAFSGIAWSPDGSKIAFYSDRDGNGEIYVMNSDGSGVSRLTNNTLEDRSPIWSPDGTKIAFVRVSGCSHCIPPRDIYVMNADGSGQVNLTNNPAPNDSPAWSPDGTRIAFFSGRDGNYEIYVMNADGSGAINLTNNLAFDVLPAWKPR